MLWFLFCVVPSRFRRLSCGGVVFTLLALDGFSGWLAMVSKLEEGSWIPGKERAERVLANAISIEILFRVECVDEVALQAMLRNAHAPNNKTVTEQRRKNTAQSRESYCVKVSFGPLKTQVKTDVEIGPRDFPPEQWKVTEETDQQWNSRDSVTVVNWVNETSH